MKINRIILFVICLQSVVAFSASILDVRRKSSSPLLYGMMDLSDKDYHAGAYAFTSRSFDPGHMASAITMNGKPYFTLNEQGATATSLTVEGDMSPKWIGLTTATQDYKSTVELSPKVRSCGMLLNFYKKCDKYFLNINSAALRCRSQVEITETHLNGTFASTSTVTTFEEAMNQSKWNYGKMGSVQKKVGLDNIQVQLGSFVGGDVNGDRALAMALLVEVPTGSGTKSEWAFEPRVGGNHFGLGFGFDDYYLNESSQVVFGANYRYLFGAKEKRSFDIDNNPWSRYIKVVSIPTSTASQGTESFGINSLTLDATVTPGHQLNSYLRWSKRWEKVHFELGYNFFFKAKEKISDIADFAFEVGVYNLADPVGSTGSGMKMDSNLSATNLFIAKNMAETPGVAISKNDLDHASATTGTQLISSASARLEYVGDIAKFGCGGSIEAAHSKHAYASWNFWINAAATF